MADNNKKDPAAPVVELTPEQLANVTGATGRQFLHLVKERFPVKERSNNPSQLPAKRRPNR